MNTAGISGSAEEQIQKQINTLGNVVETYPDKRQPAADVIGGRTYSEIVDGEKVPYQIIYEDPNAEADTIAHERTHALNAVPQEAAAKLLD